MSTPTKGRRGTRLIVLLSAIALVASLFPSVAGADAPSTYTVSGAEVVCESEAGFLGLNVIEEEWGTFLDVWFEPMEGGFVVHGFAEDAFFDGTHLTATVEMVEESWEEEELSESVPAGTLDVDVTFAPIGEPMTWADRFRDGNRWVSILETRTDAMAAGSLFLEGYFDVDLAECWATLFKFSETSTNPRAYVGRWEGQFASCELEVPGGFGFVVGDVVDEGAFTEVMIDTGEGTVLYGGTDQATLDDSSWFAEVALYPEEPMGEPVPVPAAVDASLTSTGSETIRTYAQNVKLTTDRETFDVTGTVTVDGTSYTMVGCEAASFTERVVERPAQGPKLGGPIPVNDGLEGAVVLDGSVSPAHTRGTAFEPEVECTASWEDEVWPLPIAHTLWYVVEGTGESMTVDSAGSDFDTIIGVYDADLGQIACNDDVELGSGFSFQAAVTFVTTPGELYYVQVGGFGDQYGKVRLSTD